MTPRRSAGVLAFRRRGERVEVLLGHPGGPFWARKDDGAWSIPKGEYAPPEDAFTAARREFAEELGSAPPPDGYLDLGELRASGKLLAIWAVEHDLDAAAIRSNTVELEWPPHSGRRASFPEIDRAAWFPLADAAAKLVAGQRPYLERLAARLD